jgi:predicted permease
MAAIHTPVLRAVSRTPFFALATIASLSIGIGACAAASTVVRAVFFAPLPYAEAERLVEIWSTPDPASRQRIDAVPSERIRRWMQHDFRSLETFAARAGLTVVLEGDVPERIDGVAVSGPFFQTLGVSPRLGRTLASDDDRPGAEHAVVLSGALWERRYTGDPSIIGRVLNLSGTPYTVVGVMPDAFDDQPRVWIPAWTSSDAPSLAWFGVGRLREGAEVEGAILEVQQTAAAEVTADSTSFGGMGAVAIPLGQAERGGASGPLWALVAIVSVVFLLALTNLTTLFLVRGAERGRAIAVRAALGATPWQLGRELLMESSFLAGAGAACGLVVALWGKDVLRAAIGDQFPASASPTLDIWAFGFTGALAMAAAALVGLEPLRHLTRLDLNRFLRGSGAVTTVGPGQRRTRSFVVAGQVALTITLVCVGGVLSLAVTKFGRIDLGYDADRIVAAYPDYEIAPMSDAEQLTLGLAVIDRLAGHPGVEDIALWRMSSQDYPSRPEHDAVFEAGAIDLPARLGLYRYYEVSGAFFETLGISILSGRDFGAGDSPGSPSVGIVSEGGARAWWPDQDPIGRRLKLGESGEWITVVGVAADAADLHQYGRAFSVGTVTRDHQHLPLLYRPTTQRTEPPDGWRSGWRSSPVGHDGVVVGARISRDPGPVTATLVRELGTLSPALPMRYAGPLPDWQLGAYQGRLLRLYRTLAMTLATVAFLLALLGIVGVVSDGVVRRTREIAVRKALGARSGRLTIVLVRESVLIAAAGVAVAVIAVLLLDGVIRQDSNYYRELLLGTPLIDWRALSVAITSTLAATALTSVVCARRADRIEPATALRWD